jgi:carboxypeptidase PM20D1
MLGASDSRHAARIAPAVYRFSPLFMSAAQRASVHGVDERVTADSLVKGVRFYRALLDGIA